MQLWWSTIISSPSRTSVAATIGELQRHRGADKGDSPTRAATRPRARPRPAVPISVCPLVRAPGGVGAGFQGDKPTLSHAGSASYLMVSVASRRVGSTPLPIATLRAFRLEPPACQPEGVAANPIIAEPRPEAGTSVTSCHSFDRGGSNAKDCVRPVTSRVPSERARKPSRHRPVGRLKVVSRRPALSGEERMQRSSERILTTHVGSLPRPSDLLEILKAKDEGQSFDSMGYRERVRSAVREVVEKQAAAGIDILADGEMGRVGFIPYVNERLSGLNPGKRRGASTSGGARANIKPFLNIMNGLRRLQGLPGRRPPSNRFAPAP